MRGIIVIMEDSDTHFALHGGCSGRKDYCSPVNQRLLMVVSIFVAFSVMDMILPSPGTDHYFDPVMTMYTIQYTQI